MDNKDVKLWIVAAVTCAGKSTFIKNRKRQGIFPARRNVLYAQKFFGNGDEVKRRSILHLCISPNGGSKWRGLFDEAYKKKIFTLVIPYKLWLKRLKTRGVRKKKFDIFVSSYLAWVREVESASLKNKFIDARNNKYAVISKQRAMEIIGAK